MLIGNLWGSAAKRMKWRMIVWEWETKMEEQIISTKGDGRYMDWRWKCFINGLAGGRQ